jgi:hypothetical protein
MRSEDLIRKLASDLRPVRPARHPAVSTAIWLGAAAAVIVAAVLVSGPRHDLAARLAAGFDMPQILTATATGILAAFAAFQLALPERDRRWALLPVPATIAWLATMGWGCLQDLVRLGPDALRVGMSLPCLAFIAGLGVPLTVAMLWLARHAAWLRPGPVAALGGLSAAALASVGLSLIHHLDAAVMVLVWHGASVLIVAAVASLLGPQLMRRGVAAP